MLYKIFLISSLVIMIFITRNFIYNSNFESYFTDIGILFLYLIFYIESFLSFLYMPFDHNIISYIGMLVNYLMFRYCLYYIVDDIIEIYGYYIDDWI